MQHKLVRWLFGVSGIILIIIALLIYSTDLLTGFMLAFCGALCTGLGLGWFGE